MGIHILKKSKKFCINTFWNKNGDLNKYDFIYFRRGTTFDLNFIKYFKQIIKANPNIKIFMEIPTYPYDGEYLGGIKSKAILFIDRFYRRKVYKIINRVVVLRTSNEKKLWNIEAINIVNGIDFDEVKPILDMKQDKFITISCIAKFSPWHGYERIIQGLSEYYKRGGKREIRILMCGEGCETEKYIALTKKLNLEGHIEFFGFLNSEQLESIYSMSDFGCCSLGRYKSNLNVIGDLKSRDYLARGIPIITGCDIDVLRNRKFQYNVSFPNDNTPLDFDKIISLYDSINKFDRKQVMNEIRETSKKLIDMKITFKPVVDEALRALKND